MTKPELIDVERAMRTLGDAPTKSEIQRMIERLTISADAKAILAQIAEVTVKVGQKVLAIGRKIIDIALALLKTFPNVIFGVIVGMILTALVASVPAVGGLFAAMVGPILVAFGLTTGAVADMRDGMLAARVEVFVDTVRVAVSGA